MLAPEVLEADLRLSLRELAALPLAEVLLQNGILRRLAADHVRRHLAASVRFSPEQEPLVINRLFEGCAGVQPPPSLAPGWLESLPAMAQGPLRERWDQIRLQKWMEETYRDRLEPYFLERREDLEQVVYGMIRLRNQGAAEELYLRLLDDQADFGDLAREHSLGDERFTRGLVGPMRISQPHPSIRAVLQTLAVGELHPPLQVDNWILLLRMEHRQPARLTDSTMQQLCEELLQKELDGVLDAQLAALYPSLVAAFPGSLQPHPAPLPATAAEPADGGEGPAPAAPTTAPSEAATPAPPATGEGTDEVAAPQTASAPPTAPALRVDATAETPAAPVRPLPPDA